MSDVIKTMTEQEYRMEKIKRLDRIAKALESIASDMSELRMSVEVLEPLGECVAETKYGDVIRIGGIVDTR